MNPTLITCVLIKIKKIRWHLTFGSYGVIERVFASMTETTATWLKDIFTPLVSTVIWSSIPVNKF